MSNTLFVLEPSRKAQLLIAIIKYFKLDVTIDANLESPEFKKNFPLGLIPAFIGEKGYKLTEFQAVYEYLLTFIKEDISVLVGKNAKQAAQVTSTISLAATDISMALFPALFMVNGRMPYNKKQYDEKIAKFNKIADVLEARTKEYTFLATERCTFGDIFMAITLAPFLSTILAAPFAKAHPNLMRWFNTVKTHPIIGGTLDNTPIPAQPLTFTPPKKEKKEAAPKAEKKEAVPKAAAAPAEPAAAPKPKHPLELLGKPSTPIDEWKRFYSNEETRETAIPFFWDKMYNPEEWSLWKVDYKYNDELTLTFMSNNLVGGFFNRLSASTKYMFGCMVVYGENNNNGITGAFLVRGQDYEPAFDVAPDWESYSYSKLDASKPEDKEFFENMLAWDKPVVIDGKSIEIADGKVLK
ncbi:elongation factor 1-gamma 2 [Diutina catenulata]